MPVVICNGATHVVAWKSNFSFPTASECVKQKKIFFALPQHTAKGIEDEKKKKKIQARLAQSVERETLSIHVPSQARLLGKREKKKSQGCGVCMCFFPCIAILFHTYLVAFSQIRTNKYPVRPPRRALYCLLFSSLSFFCVYFSSFWVGM